MKTLTQRLLAVVLACSLSACLFKQPVYTEGFVKLDPALGGVWAAEGKNGDLRKMEFAVCAPLDGDRCVLHSPAADKGGLYYEARMVKVRERNLLQLRLLASFNDGLPKADADPYTLVWLDGDLKGPSIKVFALNGKAVEGKGPDEVKQMLESASQDWAALFGDPTIYRRLEDK